MAVNFEKTLAIVAKASNGTDAIQLADVQINELINMNGAAANPLLVYGSAIPAVEPVLNGQGGSVTYFKNVLSDELVGDAVYADQSNAAKGAPKTIYLNSHLGYQEELTAAEVNAQGLGNWMATKLSQFTPQAMKKLVRAGFAALVADSAEVTIAAKGATESERDYSIRILKELALLAGQMATTSDKGQGVDTFSTDMITISVSPKIMAYVIAAGLQGSMTQEVFANGVVNQFTWAGIKVQSTQFLPVGVDAFIGTSFLGKAPMVSTAMYAGPKSLNGIKYEARSAFLLPGTDKSTTSGFEFIFDDVIADKTSIDYTKDFVTKLAIKLA